MGPCGVCPVRYVKLDTEFSRIPFGACPVRYVKLVLQDTAWVQQGVCPEVIYSGDLFLATAVGSTDPPFLLVWFKWILNLMY